MIDMMKLAQRSRGTRGLSRRLLSGASLAAVLVCGFSSAAHAEDRYWDADGSKAGAGGTGTWDISGLTWSPNIDQSTGPYDRPWNNGALDNAIFGTTGGTVTLGVPIMVGNITFNSTGYILSGQRLTLGGVSSTVTTNSSGTINSVIAGSSGLTKAGAGQLVLGGANIFTGNININGGSLYANTDAALGALGNNIFTAAGVSTQLTIGGAGTTRTVTIGDGGLLTVQGGGVGSARITGNGRVSVGNGVIMSNDASTYTGSTTFNGISGIANGYFTSIGNLGEASSLGAPTTVLDGTIVFNQVNQYSDNVVYLGDGDSSNRNWRINGSGGIIRNRGTGTLSITGEVSGSAAFVAETADVELLGTISGGSYGFSGNSGRTITLGGANSFTGTAGISDITVRAAVLANKGVASSMGAGTGAYSLAGSGTLSYFGSGGGTNRDWAINGAGTTIRNDGNGALDLSGGVAFAPGGGIDTLTLGGSFAGTNTLSGIIDGGGNVAVNSSGTWELSGANSFTGNVVVHAGTLRAAHASAFGVSKGVIVNGGTLDLAGYDLTTASLTGTGGTVALGSAALTVDVAKGEQSFGGTITGSGGLRKLGVGMLTLTSASTYSGATTIGGGKLVLDFSGAGGPVNNIITASSPLILSGGTLEVKGATGETNSQSFGGVTISAGSNIVRATGDGTVNLNLGAITRTGGLVNFILPGSGAITTSRPNGVLGGWATINGSDYAKVLNGAILAFDDNDYSNKDDAGDWLTNDIVSDSGNLANTPFTGTVNGDVQLGGLRYSANAFSVVSVGAGNILGVDGTMIIAPSTGTSNQTITGGSLRGGSNGGTLGIQHNGAGVFTIASSIIDNGVGSAFSKAGVGVLALTGVNSYTGATILSGGTLRFNSIAAGGLASGIGASTADASNLVIEGGTLQYTGTAGATDRGFTLVDGGAPRTIDVTQGGANLTFTGQVTSADQAGFIKTGLGTLTLANAANDYVGVTDVALGTLSVSTLANGGVASGIGAATADSGNLILRNGGRLRYTGGTTAIDRGFALTAGSGLVDVTQAGSTLTIGGIVTGGGILGKEGSGILVLSGANTYSGGTTVNGGTLRAGSATAFGAASSQIGANAFGTIELGGFNITAGMLAGTGTVSLGANTLTTAGGSGVFSGQITGSGGFTRGSGSWTQTMSGCANDYTGVTRINGSLAIDCIADGGLASGIGASGAGSANLIFGGGTLGYTGTSATTNRGFTLTGNGVIDVSNPATTLEFRGVVTGGGALFKDGDGTLILSGANNYTGPTRVHGGTLRIGSAQALGTVAPMLLSNIAGAVLDLAGYDTSVSYLELGGAVGGTVMLNGATLTIATGNASATSYFGGAISGPGNLIKNGNGAQRLTGCDSDYSGTTTINGGVLAVSCLADGGLASSMGTSSAEAGNLVLSGGTLRYAGTGGSTNRQFMLGASGGNGLDASGTGAIHFTSSAAVTFSGANSAQTLKLTGTNTGNNILAAGLTNNGSGLTSLTKEGAGTWILSNAASSYTGVTTISGGVLGIDKLANGGQASSIGASSAAASNLVIGKGSTLRYTGAGDNTDRLFTLDSGLTYIESAGTGAIVLTNTGAVTLASPGLARTIALGGTSTGNNMLAGSIGNSGAGVTTLAKNDSGTWVLTGDHSYTGVTNINDGFLSIGGGGTTGSVASATINNFGGLGFNRSNNLTYGGGIVGTGSVRQSGSGTTLLTGTNLYTGGTTVAAGTLQLGNGGATGSIVGDVANDGIFTFNRNNTYLFASLISGSGEVRQIGSGTTTLTADHSYGGGTRISAGTLQLGNGGATGSILGDVANNGTLAFNRSNALSFGGAISGLGALSKLGAGTLTLTANNSYSGATTINAGTLLINGDQSAATGLTTVNNGATLGGSGTIGGDVFIANGGSLNPGNSPGTLTIAGNLALSGGSALNFEFGQADVAGGPLNDLIDVGGNLILDGTINVAVPAGGAFDAGVYRVFNYGGQLTDNGLTLGGMPAGSDVTVQTAVAGQVNLVNSTGLALSFWDGAAGPKVNGQVNGGNGSWHLGGADNNWTDAAGGINAAYADGTFAIFSGAAGTVAIDNSLGAVSALGMQFASNGYNINGQPLALVGPQSVIRVGDGTALGAGFTATIASNLTGASQLAKTDRGTLVLSGTNSYTGGTLIDEGTLSISSDANLGDAAGAITIKNGALYATASMSSGRAVTLRGAATLSVQPGVALLMSGVIDGAGSLTKAGGLVILTGDNSYTGGTTITEGTLQIGAGTTTGSIVGDVVNNSALVFNRSNDLLYAGAISGIGQLTKASTGTLTMTGISTYAGTTNVNAGKLLLQSGGQINGTSNLAVGGGGEMIVDGLGARLFTGSTSSVIGNTAGSSGTLTVRNGGTASFAALDMANGNNGTGTLNIVGNGSMVTHAENSTFGRVGTANINILGGGKMMSSGIGVLVGGQLPINSRAVVTVSGAGSEWNVTNALNARRGSITIADGGVVTAGSAIIGLHAGVLNNPSMDVIVTGAGSRFETSGTLVITNSSTSGSRGVLTIADGAVVKVGSSTLEMGPGNAVLHIGDSQMLPVGKRAGVLDAAELTFAAATNQVNFNHIDSDYVFATRMSGVGEVISSRGTTILTADNAYSGQTHINGGMIIVNGNQSAATGKVNVMAGGALGGRGVIGGAVDLVGRIAPGDLGAAPGTLTINGDLNIFFSANLDYSFGQANVIGGAYNDLITVGGNLALDGTLNVNASAGGDFGPGLYRVISYGGVLIDAGLDIGVRPPGSLVSVQTSVAGQVNLINSAGATLNFWDGAVGPKFNSGVNGGNGVWQASAGNDNWTNADGLLNAGFSDASFAIFSAAPGMVAIDNSLGDVAAAGVQFASDGYVITGDALALVGPTSTLRVGDGTADGLGYTATIDAALTGDSQLVKTDIGTLVLSGTNSYTGGTLIDAGTLRISRDANLGDAAGALGFDGGTLNTTANIVSSRAVNFAGNAIFDTDSATSLTLGGVVSGAGSLAKNGAGTLVLGGGNNYGGTTDVRAGSLFVNGDQSSVTGLTSVASGAMLGGTGIIGGNVTIADGAKLAAGTNGVGTLGIKGNLALSAGSVLDFEFGEANVTGGVLNDLVNVGGNLTLDGTINVTLPAGGNFGPGIYRAFNYGGSLIDNGLTLGTMPGSGTVSVQTAIAGQVNLVNTRGLTLSFWDGGIGPKNNGAINGGNGVWRLSDGWNNWADMTGSVNADYTQDSFAIFSAAPGMVTVDNSGGDVLASGMQFASNGYAIAGDRLTLTGASAIIQVGDSSAAGAGYIATIGAELAGSARLVKTDLGTLVLTKTNSYTGGTMVNGGTLQIGNGGATGSIMGDIANDGALVVNRSGLVTLDGVISGTGSLTKVGGGILTLAGINSYTGGTTIGAGTVRVSSDANLGDVAGMLSLQGGTLQADASFTSGRAILLGSTNSNRIDTQGFDVTLGGVIGNGPNNGAGNFLDKLGSGTLTLTGANTYANRTLIAGGTLALAGAGTIGAGNLVVGAGTVFDISQTNSGARVIQLGGGANGTIALGSKTLTLGLSNSFSDWAGTITDGGIGGGTGGKVVVSAFGGAVRYFGATSYTGGTTVAAGSFELAGNGALYSQGAVAVNGGGLFNIAGIAAAGTAIGDLSGVGIVSLGGKSLTFGTANDTAFSGLITGNGGALVKTGTGTFTLSGANSYTGATNLTAGTLLVNGNQSAATGLTSVASGAMLGGTGTIGGNVIIADSATLAPGVGGAGALTINGGLTLSGGSTLAYEFGAANAVGSPLNDIVHVGGDLMLDGMLDVAATPGGAFGIGLYRIANYGGTLTDNGLVLGAMPAGADVFVQTSVAKQVNLINVGGATLNFWDGAAGSKFNGAVNGGDGIWQNSSGNNNWADATGAVNAGYDDGAFAIFTGTAGTVTIDNSLGAVAASGLQFAADGYRITGQALTFSGPQAVVRVGDGTVAGAGYTSTIDSAIGGATQLVKTDAGTLVLTGTNSYTGGTTVNGGTLRIASDANLGAASGGLGLNGGTLYTTADMSSGRAVDLAGAGSFLTDAGTTLTLTGSVGGSGGLTKAGGGTLVLGGTGSHGGGTTVAAGTLLVNGDYAGATGATNVALGATLGGTGVIGGDVVFANGATLAPGAGGAGTLTIGGNLSLAGGSRLDFEVGEAGVSGGALNDLVNVGGNLTLDGTIDVGVPAGGAFDVGVYRLFNYGGTLTDNGLSLGTLPTGANADVQTSIAGQVNLVNSAGLTLNFWDGAAGPKNNGAVNGGDGVWQAGAGNDHWTEASGGLNAAYSDGAFAVFGGTAGTATVDDALGAVSVAGMQFAANGYVIAGDGITLSAPQTVVRVGDGSVGGKDFKATINAVLGGSAELVKTDAGTLVLGGANSYTGGTRINGGTVQISRDANLGAAAGKVTLGGGTLATSADLSSGREIAVTGPGTIATAADTSFTFSGQFTGAGVLAKAGAGTLRVTGNSDGFGGSTTVAAGTLAVQGRLGGAVTVASGARLEGGGRIGSLVNAGVVAPGNGIGTLTIAGDYEGRGGVLEIEAELGGDTSASDRLVVVGATAGNTTVRVTNRGGLGAPTVEGIKIVDVAGASNGSFALDGDYLFEGQQAVVVGAYGYRLVKNGIASPQDGDWYLRSALLNPIDPEVPLYQPGIPVYEAYVGALQALNGLPTLQQRVGNRSWAGTSGADGTGIWGRFESQRLRPESAFSTSSADRKAEGWQAQMGADMTLAQCGDGATLVGGINAHYGTVDTAVTSIFGNGSIDTKGYGVGASLTWYGPQGFYVDGQAKLSWFDSDLKSGVLGALVEGNDGKGRAFSVELGKRSQIGGNLTVTPQIQMSYAHVGFDRFADPVDAAVSADEGDSLKTRWGLSLDHQQSWGATGEGRRTHLYATVNLAYEWLDSARVLVSGTPIENRGQRLTGELGLGGSYSWGRLTLYTEVAGDTALADFGTGYSLKGTAGLRMRF